MTNAEYIRSYALDLLKDGEVYNFNQIKSYVENCMKDEALSLEMEGDYTLSQAFDETGFYFTDNMYYGALRELVNKNPDIKIVTRGKYQKQSNDDVNNAFLNELAVTLLSCSTSINEKLNEIKFSEANQNTVNVIVEMKKLINEINNKRNDILQDDVQI